VTRRGIGLFGFVARRPWTNAGERGVVDARVADVRVVDGRVIDARVVYARVGDARVARGSRQVFSSRRAMSEDRTIDDVAGCAAGTRFVPNVVSQARDRRQLGPDRVADRARQ